MPYNYCYHSKKSKLIYFEFSSHCLMWLASLHRAEPSLIFWLAKIACRAELGSFTCRAEPSRAELGSFPALLGGAGSIGSLPAPIGYLGCFRRHALGAGAPIPWIEKEIRRSCFVTGRCGSLILLLVLVHHCCWYSSSTLSVPNCRLF